MSLVGLLIFVLVVGLVFYMIVYFLDHIPQFEPFRMVAKGIIALICILLLLGVLFGGVSVPVLRIT